VALRITRLRDLRNRIGHHHRIWSQPCSDLHADLPTVAGFLSPDLARWIAARSQVPSLLAQDPLLASDRA
jgi:hypothetical protein